MFVDALGARDVESHRIRRETEMFAKIGQTPFEAGTPAIEPAFETALETHKKLRFLAAGSMAACFAEVPAFGARDVVVHDGAAFARLGRAGPCYVIG